MKKYLLTLALCIAALTTVNAQQEVKWLRTPAISPDGSQIVFGYMGNLYKVSSEGGVATPLTSGDSYNTRPVWSRDGKTIAYASDLYGNYDVFVMPALGGVPVRLTYNSYADYPYDFTPDSKYVLFGSGRYDPAQSVRFPDLMFKNLYTIPVGGGRPVLVSAAGADEAHYNSDGTKIVFQDKKGYEDAWRKHHTSSVTRDIWIYDIKSNTYTKVSDFEGENLMPVFSPDGGSVYYTSEKDKTLNIYNKNLATGAETKLTSFKDFPVREVSIANDGTLAFVWKGEIYTLKPGQRAKKLKVSIATNAGYQKSQNLNIKDATEAVPSPNGKEIALINRGELFVVGVEDGRTKRITNTPYQERMVTWAPDGKAIYFAQEDGTWNICKATLKDTTEKYFYASTIVNIEPVVKDGKDNFQPDVSPDGKKLAYICERNILKVMDLKSKKTVTVLPKGHNHSYRDGDWGFEWSPDSKWLLVDDQKNDMRGSNLALISAEGGDIQYPINSGYGERGGQFSFDGKAIVFYNAGAVKAAFFDKEEYDKFMLSKADYELLLEKEKDQKKDKDDKAAPAKAGKDKKDDKKDNKKDSTDKASKEEPIKVNLKGIDHRIATLASGNVYNYVITRDGKKLYYTQRGENGNDLYVLDTRSREPKKLSNIGNTFGLTLSKDEKTLFGVRGGSPVKIDVNNGVAKPVAISGKMQLDAAGERAYMFDHIWLQVKKKFYDPAIHGIDWKMYHDEYAKFLPYINNNYDFQVLLSEMLGELNASHTGGRYYPARDGKGAAGDVTASLGLLFDETYKGEGIKVSEIIPNGPADKSSVKIKVGDIITAIDGEKIGANDNYYRLLNNISNANTILTVKSDGNTFNQTIRPVNQASISGLMYDRWTEKMEEMVDKMSGGQIGYVHVQGMNNASYRVVYDKLMGKHKKKKAVIIDTRFNGGGWLHDDLVTLLGNKEYLKFAPQGDVLDDGEPLGRWTKPSAVITCEGNYSDAFIFPFVYQQNKVGKVYGMPVPGTGTAVWWETLIDPSIIFGIPMVATQGLDGVTTENTQFEPDVKVELPYNDFLSGKDPQLEAAVKGLLKEIK